MCSGPAPDSDAHYSCLFAGKLEVKGQIRVCGALFRTRYARLRMALLRISGSASTEKRFIAASTGPKVIAAVETDRYNGR